MTAKADTAKLVMGELVGDKPALRDLPCDVPGVTARQTKRKADQVTIEERLYECANGLALGVRRGGPLHLADPANGTWEGFVLGYNRTVISDVAGWVDEATVLRWVRKLAAYRDPARQPVTSGCAS